MVMRYGIFCLNKRKNKQLKGESDTTTLNLIWPYIDIKTGPIFKARILRFYVTKCLTTNLPNQKKEFVTWMVIYPMT